MAGPRDIKAGRAYVELGANDKYSKGIRAFKSQLSSLGKNITRVGLGMAAAGAAAAGALVGAAYKYAQFGSQIQHASERTGVAVEALSELAFAAERSDSSLADLETAFKTMSRNIRDAGNGLSTSVMALDDLGLSAQQLLQLKPEDQFKLIADRLNAIPNATKRTAIAMQLMGRAGTKLTTLLLGGAAGMEELRQRARDLGLTISGPSTAAATKLGDTFGDLLAVVNRTVYAVGEALGPALQKTLDVVVPLYAKINKFVQANQQLVLVAASVAGALLVAGVAVVALGLSMQVAAAALGGLMTLLAAPLAIISGIGTAIAGLGSIVAAVMTSVVVQVGLGIAAGVALGVIIARMSENGRAGLKLLADAFTSLKEDATQVLGAIGKALAAGDVQLAAKILWAALNYEWTKGVESLKELWAGFKVNFLTVYNQAMATATGFFGDLVDGMRAAWTLTVQAMTNTWVTFASTFSTVWTNVVSSVSKQMLKLYGILDKTFDSNAAIKIAETNRLADLKRITDKATADFKANDKQAFDALAKIGQGNKATHDALIKLEQDALKAVQASGVADIDAAAAALAKARKEFEDALNATPGSSPGSAPGGGAFPDSIAGKPATNGLEGWWTQHIDDLMAVPKNMAIQTRGITNPAALRSLQTGDKKDDAIKDNTKRTATATEEMQNSLRRLVNVGGGIMFG